MDKMKIGFYKPGKMIYFHNLSKDYASWSYEVTQLMKIFAQYGNECYILSPSDYIEGSIENIYKGKFSMIFDRVFFFSGVYDDAVFTDLQFIQSNAIDFYFTDLRLWAPDAYINKFRRIYSIQRNYKNRFYAGNNETYLFQQSIRSLKEKDIYFYYGGGERNRLEKIFEYVIRPKVIWTGKSSYFNIDTRLYDRNEYLDYMDRAKYSICIVDKDYSSTYALTQRHYENIIHNIVSFVDNDFDSIGFVIPYDYPLRVNSYKEMYDIMEFLDKNPIEYLRVLEKQKTFLRHEYINGSYVYKLLMA